MTRIGSTGLGCILVTQPAGAILCSLRLHSPDQPGLLDWHRMYTAFVLPIES